ncbi:hypothetical protein ACE103_09295 [Bradyrhizobium sp. ma5]|uniref:hypothetical protein n=1 Tax=Bradyrhizobium sp. ma5 TaxID=3344828 RepID=UPI0035D463C8
MWGTFRRVVSVCLSTLLAGCASLYAVHDPSTGVLTTGQVQGFLKSLRCELITFYELERSRKAAFLKARKAGLLEAYANYAYFDVSPSLFGAITLELKITDGASIGSGTVFDYRLPPDFSKNTIAHLGPTASAQGVYDLIWSFLLKQNAKLTTSASLPAEADPMVKEQICFNGPGLGDLAALEALAEDAAPQRALFTRIKVDFGKPLAAWLRDKATIISAGQLLPAADFENAEAAQMYYQFAVQVVAGLDAKYSLTSVHWNALAGNASASLQQNSYVSLYINGPGAAYVNGAKSGSAGFLPKGPELGSAENPMHVVTQGGKPVVGGAQEEGPQTVVRPPRRREQRYLLAPVPIFPPSATP